MGFLTLQRKLNETIVIANDIYIKPTSFNGKKVRISIQAPDGISIDRLEVHEKKMKEQFNRLDAMKEKLKKSFK